MKMKPKMKVGDLVRLSSEAVNNLAPEERDQIRWIGLVIDTVSSDGIDNGVVVYWTEDWPHSLEYTHHLETINESR